MKERVQEQGGRLEIRSDANGTEIIAKIPIGADVDTHPTTTEPLLKAS
jgi:signal transduction histidine kinase